MKQKLDKTKLKKEKHIRYKSENPDVKFAEILIFDYQGEKIYQPRIIANNGHYMTNGIGFYSMEDAEKAIDVFASVKEI